MSKNTFTIRRITTDAVLVALYVVFAAVFSVKLPFAEISLASIPILMCALLFGAPDVLAVSVMGSFIEQMLGGYGLSVSTPLWMAPVVLQGLAAALLFYLFKALCIVLFCVPDMLLLSYIRGFTAHFPIVVNCCIV